MHFPLLGMFFLKIFTWLASLPSSGTSCLLISEAFSPTTQLKISLSLETLLPFLIFFHNSNHHAGFPGDLVVKNPPANAGDLGLISGSGRSPGEENGHPLQYSSLGNPTDRGAWWATVHGGHKESDTT